MTFTLQRNKFWSEWRTFYWSWRGKFRTRLLPYCKHGVLRVIGGSDGGKWCNNSRMYSKCSDAQLADREERRHNIKGRVRFPVVIWIRHLSANLTGGQGHQKENPRKTFFKKASLRGKTQQGPLKDIWLSSRTVNLFMLWSTAAAIYCFYLFIGQLIIVSCAPAQFGSVFYRKFLTFHLCIFFITVMKKKEKSRWKYFDWTVGLLCLFTSACSEEFFWCFWCINNAFWLFAFYKTSTRSVQRTYMKSVFFLFEMDTHKTKSIIDKTFQCHDGYSSSSLPTSPTNVHRQQWLLFGSEPLRVGSLFGAFLLALISGGADWTALTFRSIKV